MRNRDELKSTPKKNRVLVAMSGGVDSSVALLRVLEEGYDAIGATMKLWDHGNVDGLSPVHSYCCSAEAVNNAKQVCEGLGVPHYALDFQDAFQENVVDYLVEEYFAGHTPNPCIRCNTRLRWGALLDKADDLGTYWLATGHYARIDRTDPEIPLLKKGRDPKKDQSYVLWGISRKALKRTLFPLGDLTKKEVRMLARASDLVTADIVESQELCFLPNNDYRQFLKAYVPEKTSREMAGDFLNEEGDILGKHQGISHYTIGQRRGLGVTAPRALYVQKIDRKNNTIVLAQKERVFFDGCTVRNLNWLYESDENLSGRNIHAVIRYNHSGVPCTLSPNTDGTMDVKFESPQFAVTPGQSAVFYSGDLLLGGGIIVGGFLNA